MLPTVNGVKHEWNVIVCGGNVRAYLRVSRQKLCPKDIHANMSLIALPRVTKAKAGVVSGQTRSRSLVALGWEGPVLPEARGGPDQSRRACSPVTSLWAPAKEAIVFWWAVFSGHWNGESDDG